MVFVYIGSQVKNMFQASGLPQQQLAQIWYQTVHYVVQHKLCVYNRSSCFYGSNVSAGTDSFDGGKMSQIQDRKKHKETLKCVKSTLKCVK